MRLRFLAILSALLLAGCQPPKERVRFTSARLAPDGRTGLFVFKREVYYPGAIGLLGPGRKDRYVVNRSIVGAYDLADGGTRVLQRRDHGDRYVHENDDFRILDVWGSRALLWGGGGMYYRLDIDTGELTPLPLKGETEARGRAVGQLHLVDEAGTMVLVNKSLPDSLKMTAAPEEIWVRRPSGEYERVAEVRQGSGGFYGFKENEVHFYSAERRADLIYNLDRRDFRAGNPRDIPYKSYDQTASFIADDHGSPRPRIGRKVDGRWEYRDAQIDIEELR